MIYISYSEDMMIYWIIESYFHALYDRYFSVWYRSISWLEQNISILKFFPNPYAIKIFPNYLW